MQLDSRSLSFLLTRTLNLEYSSSDFEFVFAATVEHFTQHTKITDYHKKLSSVVDFSELEISASQLRILLSETGYVMLNLRYYSAYLAGYRGLTSLVAEELYSRYDLCRCDARLAYKAILAQRTTLKKYLTSKRQNYKDYSCEEFNKVRTGFSVYAEELNPYIRRITEKKLRFVYKFNNLDRRDFHSELTISAIRAYYKAQPTNKSYMHMLNYLKASVKNKTVNIIQSYTTEKRQTLVRHGEGDSAVYVLNIEAESQSLALANNATDGDYGTNFDNNVLEDAHVKPVTEFELSVQKLLTRYKKTKKGFILKVFLGMEVERFTEWLKSKRTIRSVDRTGQDFLSELTYPDRLKCLAEFIGNDVDYVTKKIGELAVDLGLNK